MPSKLAEQLKKIRQRSGSTVGAAFSRAAQLDIASIADQLNSVYHPLVSSLVMLPNLDALQYGLSGNVIYADIAADPGSSSIFYDSVLQRPKTLKESLDSLLAEIALGGSAESLEGISAYDDTNVRSLISRNELNLKQLKLDTIGGNYVFAQDGEAKLSYPLAQHLDALGAFFDGYPGTGITHSGSYPDLSFEVNLSDVVVDTTLPEATITNLPARLNTIRSFVGMDTPASDSPTYSNHGDIYYVEDGQSLEEGIQTLDAATRGVAVAMQTGYLKVFENEAAVAADDTVYIDTDLYSKALQADNLTEYVLTSVSPTIWSKLGGGSTMREELFSLGMADEFPVIFPTGEGTVTFPAAPKDILVRKLRVTYGAVNPQYVPGPTQFWFIQNILVNDVSIGFAGVTSFILFSEEKEYLENLNIVLNQGDILKLEVGFVGLNPTIPSGDFALLYKDLPGVVPGTQVSIGTIDVLPEADEFATLTLTVETAPLSSGSFGVINHFFSTSSFLATADGARTPGENDFDNTIADINDLATEIATAINDGSNDFIDLCTAVADGADVILTSVIPGAAGNKTRVNLAGIDDVTASSNTFLGGGTSSDFEVELPAVVKDGVIKRVSLETFTSETDVRLLVINALTVNDGGNLLVAPISGADLSVFHSPRPPELNFPVEEGDVIKLYLNSYGPGFPDFGTPVATTVIMELDE